jgi:hypothetical protein
MCQLAALCVFFVLLLDRAIAGCTIWSIYTASSLFRPCCATFTGSAAGFFLLPIDLTHPSAASRVD